MISGKAPLWISAQDSSTFVALVSQRLEAGGYTVVRSFDLQPRFTTQEYPINLKEEQTGCICRMVILLVYGLSGPPVSLTFLNSGIKTALYINDDTLNRAGACSCTLIANLLSSGLESHDSIVS